MSVIDGPNLFNISNLIFYLDAVNPRSYPGSGSTWYDLSANRNNFTLFNSPTFVPAGTTSSIATTVYSGPPITSMSFNGSTQYLSATTSTTWLVGGGDFTIEAWIYLTGYSANYTGIYGASIATNQATGSNFQGWQFNVGGTVNSWTSLGFTVNPGLATQSASFSFSLNTWYHVAVAKNGSTTTLFVNGNSIGSGTTISSWTDWSVLNVGRLDYTGYNYYFPGYISNLRIIRGQPHYTGTFTPPTSVLSTTESARTNVQALTTSAYTVFLLNSSTFVDSSSYNISVTNNGASIVTTTAPTLTTPTSPSSVTVTEANTYLSFNGTNQYVRSTNAINFNAYSAVTIEIGYRTTSTATQVLYETTGTGGSTVTGGISLVMNTNNTTTVSNLYFSNWWTYGSRLFGFTPSTNTTFNSLIDQYVNGVDATGRQTYVNASPATYFTNTTVVSTATTTTSGLAFANTWTYIASRNGTGNFFNGDIAYIRAWGTKVSTNNIIINFISLAARQQQSYQTPTFITNDPTGQPPALYSFTTFTFGTAATRGYQAPTLSTLRSYSTYSAQSTWTGNNSYLNYFTNSTFQGYQLWTVPATGSYTIEAAGSAAWNDAGTLRGGYGYARRANFSLISGEKIIIVCGQPGLGSRGSNVTDGGGGGGTYVIRFSGTTSTDPTTLNCTPLLISGGGGHGSTVDGNTAAADGNANENASASQTNQPGGTSGNGGGAGVGGQSCAGQGAGYLGDAGETSCGTLTTVGVARGFFTGLLGGAGTCQSDNRTNNGQGGFGGGGGNGCGGSGGGGGYSGGAGSWGGGYGSGGGSYINTGLASSITNVGATNGSYGYVTITKL